MCIRDSAGHRVRHDWYCRSFGYRKGLPPVSYTHLDVYKSQTLTSDIVSFLSKKNQSKGVRIELGEEDTVRIEIGFLALFLSLIHI